MKCIVRLQLPFGMHDLFSFVLPVSLFAVGGRDGLLPPGWHRRAEERAGDGDHLLSPAVHVGQAAGDLGEGVGDSRGLQGRDAHDHLSRPVQEEVQEGHVKVLPDCPRPMVTLNRLHLMPTIICLFECKMG
jgi:hypothetical protein